MLKLFPDHHPPTNNQPITRRNYRSASLFYLFVLGSMQVSSSDNFYKHDPNIRNGRGLNKLEMRPFLFESEVIRMEIERIGVRKIVCGAKFLFLLLNDGSAFGNGSNEYCQLMNGRVGSEQQLEKVLLENICDIYCGDSYTYCLVREEDELRMYSAGLDRNFVCSQGEIRKTAYCKLNRVCFKDFCTGNVQFFPPQDESILDVKCTSSQVGILTVDRSNTKYIYLSGCFEGLSGMPSKFLTRKVLSEKCQNAEGLFFRGLHLFFLNKDGTPFDNSWNEYKYKMVSPLFGLQKNGQLVALDDHATIPLLNEICFDSITLRRKMIAISNTGDIYMDKSNSLDIVKIELENYLNTNDRKTYLSNRSSFSIQIASRDDLGFILVTRKEDSSKFRKLLSKHPSDLTFHFAE